MTKDDFIRYKLCEHCDEYHDVVIRRFDDEFQDSDCVYEVVCEKEKKLQDAEKRIAKIEGHLKELIDIVKNNHAYHGQDNSWTCVDKDCVGCQYQEKIKE